MYTYTHIHTHIHNATLGGTQEKMGRVDGTNEVNNLHTKAPHGLATIPTLSCALSCLLPRSRTPEFLFSTELGFSWLLWMQDSY